MIIIYVYRDELLNINNSFVLNLKPANSKTNLYFKNTFYLAIRYLDFFFLSRWYIEIPVSKRRERIRKDARQRYPARGPETVRTKYYKDGYLIKKRLFHCAPDAVHIS